LLTEESPRDRAVGIGSKEALVQTRCEGAKQLAFPNSPFGGTTEEVMPEIAKVFAEVLWPIGECLYHIERLSKGKDTRQPQQELLPNSMAGS
jgi:hypothetical protein